MLVIIKRIVPFLFLLFLFPQTAFAEGADFGVSAVLPENQVSTASYFDLAVDQGSTQELTIKLKNQSSQAKKILLTPVDGETDNQGAIIYQKTLSDSKSALSSWVSSKQSIDLAAKETNFAVFTLTIPKNATNGTYLAAFQIKEQSSSDSSAGISNKFAYILGLKVTVGKAPEPSWQLTKVQQESNQLLLSLKNASQSLASQNQLQVSLKKIGTNQKISHTQAISGAPFGPFQIAVENPELTDGTYQLTLNITGTTTTKVNKTYSVRKIHGTFVFREIDLHQQRRVGLIALSVFFLLIGLYFFIWHKKNQLLDS
ncbi:MULTISPECIES: WxL protein peptidoglycan domain-containing protein [Enterococcus]|uniref:WxL protein peptidoglycan domain-containing protein n=1 Tax=Enterococcus TaxID=1350 RepID=UPI00065E5F6C|nr:MULTISPECIES: DUF916 domain-containing protein [Enterococcus]KAF1303366.1 hypothetical protein BAU16_04755 [Enterococcus sp. JM9B]